MRTSPDPSLNVVRGYRLDAMNTFRVRTLRALGYRTRVILGNGSDRRTDWATHYRVDVSVSLASRSRERTFEGVARIAPGARFPLDCERFVDGIDAEAEIAFHLIPEALVPEAVDGLIDLVRDRLYFYFNAQDHYVEYHRAGGFAAGILYQSGAFNYDLFSRERSTLIQAPKCYVSDEVDTFLSVVNSSAEPSYAITAKLRCALVAGDEHDAITWTEELAPFAPKLISLGDRVRERMQSLGSTPRFFCLYAISEDATLLPITIQQNKRTHAIGLEHSLPPLYYAAEVRGPSRTRAIQALGASAVFAPDASTP